MSPSAASKAAVAASESRPVSADKMRTARARNFVFRACTLVIRLPFTYPSFAKDDVDNMFSTIFCAVTEQENPETRNLSFESSLEIVRLMNEQDSLVAPAVALVLPEIGRTVKIKCD